jgi:hypothetical protein
MVGFYEYNDLVAELEREWRFDEAIQQLENYIAEFEKHYKLTARYRKYNGNRIKCLVWRSKDGEADFCHPYGWAGAIYLKMGTPFALEYWNSLRSSPYYEDDSDFKSMVESGWNHALCMQEKNYVYKPQTKVNQAKFLEYAKSKGWR